MYSLNKLDSIVAATSKEILVSNEAFSRYLRDLSAKKGVSIASALRAVGLPAHIHGNIQQGARKHYLSLVVVLRLAVRWEFDFCFFTYLSDSERSEILSGLIPLVKPVVAKPRKKYTRKPK